jgi:hypothetical protein
VLSLKAIVRLTQSLDDQIYKPNQPHAPQA